MDNGNLMFAFGLTLFAGLSTGIGGALAFFTKRTNTKFLAVSLGFSAGVMIYISFVELFEEARKALMEELGATAGSWAAVAAFFGGMLLIGIIDRLVPSAENPHEARSVEETRNGNGKSRKKVEEKKLMRIGVLTALAIAIHNFPEGFVTFFAALRDPALGISIAIAVAIHNIPEGIAVSVPVYYATGSRKKAFFYSFLSGLAEPAGAIIGYLILAPFLTETLFGIIFAGIAGIMVFISFDQLLPAAREYGKHHLSILGLIGGMIVMAISLLLLL